MSKTRLLASVLYRTGAARLLDLYWGRSRLTVLAYHRILDATAPDFPYFRPNVSATPDMFERQMAYVARHFSVIDLGRLQDYLINGSPLPDRPLLITFDDGYLDNYTSAYPVLKKFGFPAVIFLVADWMNTQIIPWWDDCAYCFQRTDKRRAALPLVGDKDLSTPTLRASACNELIARVKLIPEREKPAVMAQLHAVLEPPDAPPGERLFMTWDEVRDLVAHGVACQPHTLTHPILTRIEPAEARRQIAGARIRLEHETGQTATAFAYPNGTPGDYDQVAMQALRDEGYKVAFTLTPGPMRADQARQSPLELRRVFLGYKDSFEVFVMKVNGLPALMPGIRGL